jgi:hypothetical protein
LPVFTPQAENTVVPLRLDVHGSAFIVFRKAGKAHAAGTAENFPAPEAKQAIATPWQVSFETDPVKRGAPATTFPTLIDWATSDNPAIKYYSGTAVYTNSFKLDAKADGATYLLDLGKVGNMAKVKINGQYAGGAWTPPYRVDVTPYVKAGDNAVEVEVVNCWVNRIIGDLQLPVAERKLTPAYSPWKADSPLMPSGLQGPVELLTMKYK